MSTPELIITEQGEPDPTPDTYTPLSTVGALLINSMQPWITEHLAWYLDAIGSMFDSTYSIVYDQGTDGQPAFIPGYGELLNPMICPPGDLGYLGQYVGVQIPVGQDIPTAQALVTAEAGQNRGTLASLQSAITRSISNPWTANTAYTSGHALVSNGVPPTYYSVVSGYTSGATFGATDLANLAVINPLTQFTVIERSDPNGNPNAYFVNITVNPAQLTPVSNDAALIANVGAVLPGGIITNLAVAPVAGVPWGSATKTWANAQGAWGYVITGDV